MNKEEFIGKLEMVYVGDRNAFDEIVEDNQKLKNEVVYSKVEIDRLNNIIDELEKWLEERTYGMNEIHTYKIGALEDEVILNKLKKLKGNNNE